MRQRIRHILAYCGSLLATSLVLAAAPAAAAPQVVVTIPPLHSIVSAVAGSTATPYLLVSGAASPHTYSLKPSDARALQEAKLVVWAGPQIETFLDAELATLAPQARIITFLQLDGLIRYPVREDGVWGADPHNHHGHGHGHEKGHEQGHGEDDTGTADNVDGHAWLDPRNAIVLSGAVADALAQLDADTAATYRANHAAQTAALTGLDSRIAQILAPVQERPFLVFHDAYQYFETRYGLTAAGAVTLSPEAAPGARRVRDIQDRITEYNVACVFAEPQFQPAILDAVTEGTSARIAVLDPIGAGRPPGPDLYSGLMLGLAENAATCLRAPN